MLPPSPFVLAVLGSGVLLLAGVLLARLLLLSRRVSCFADPADFSPLDALLAELGQVNRRIGRLESSGGSRTWTAGFALWALRRRRDDLEARRRRLQRRRPLRASWGGCPSARPGQAPQVTSIRRSGEGVTRDERPE